MASFPVHGGVVYATPSSSQAPTPNLAVNTHYYLTEGLEGVAHKQYRGPRAFTLEVMEQADQATLGNAGQYMVYCPVTQQQFTSIDRIRDRRHKGLRFMYPKDEQALVVKITISVTHDVANPIAGGFEEDMVLMGSTTMITPSGLKDPDSSFAPLSHHCRGSWLTLVIETGLSRCLPCLTADSRWWLEKATEAARMVTLISVSREEMRLHIEKWENVSMPRPSVTHADQNGPMPTATKTQEIDIVGDVVTGAPLTLEFEKLMLPQPGAREGDIIFDINDLQSFATRLWRWTQ
ncbi:hypothetical protein C7212DRAFT_345380 [Tuber magnatum]|uniref:Uncharacterized protein n=1 Tax=Tuber magnatum TaxID=42249 RepID=A0A317SM92_9PEZI|nr:hypothetical protein C7212DRAFT_345380 [Tuber magnatum]